MNRHGWIKLHRKTLDSKIFADPYLFKIFSWCLLKASKKRETKTFSCGLGKITVEVKPGQFIYGRLAAAEELQMKPSSIRNRLKKIEKFGCINIYPKKTHSIIYITKWALFQVADDSINMEDSIKKDGEVWEQRLTWVQKK